MSLNAIKRLRAIRSQDGMKRTVVRAITAERSPHKKSQGDFDLDFVDSTVDGRSSPSQRGCALLERLVNGSHELL